MRRKIVRFAYAVGWIPHVHPSWVLRYLITDNATTHANNDSLAARERSPATRTQNELNWPAPNDGLVRTYAREISARTRSPQVTLPILTESPGALALTASRVDSDFVENVYWKLASVYDMIFGPTLYPGRLIAIERMGVRPGDNILEVGVGTGIGAYLYPPQVPRHRN